MTTQTTAAEAIAAKERELAEAREAMATNFNRHAGTSSMRGKQHGQRIDAQIRRGAQLGETVQRLEHELVALRQQASQPQSAPLDLSRLSFARFVRTKYGWYEVVKANAKSVKVVATPGMDDRIPVSRIIEIREG